MNYILKDIFGDTKRIRIIEELIENWGEFLSIEELSRMAQTSKKTAYKHIKELKKIGILEYDYETPRRFKLKENDKRAISLAILESEEYLRKSELKKDIKLEKLKSTNLEIIDYHPLQEDYN